MEIDIPDKCMNCRHSSVMFEEVHQGWCNYQLEAVVRCDCAPQKYRVGCVCAEIYCALNDKPLDNAI